MPKTLLIPALLLPFVVACGGGAPEPATSEAPAEPTAVVVDAATAGGLTGTITLDGDAPAAEVIRMNADPVCVREVTDTVTTQYFVVGDDGGVGNVFVYVKEGLSGSFPAPTETLTLDQRGCRYHPHVFGIQVGQPLEILNSDPTLHNIHAIPAVNQEFNTGQPIQGMKFSRTFTDREVMVPFKCDVHGWMNSYAGVLDHPYFAVTGTDGTFSIDMLPPGDYVIEAWHEKLGTQTQDMTVGPQETKELSFTFTPAT